MLLYKVDDIGRKRSRRIVRKIHKVNQNERPVCHARCGRNYKSECMDQLSIISLYPRPLIFCIDTEGSSLRYDLIFVMNTSILLALK